MNPRAYPTGPRYRANRPSQPPPKRARRLSIRAGAIATASLVLVASAVGGLLWPTSGDDADRRESRATALEATRPRDVVVALPTATARPEPTPSATATPRPVPVRDPTLTAEEIEGTVGFAHKMLDLETKQRQINRDYRFYDIDLLSRWVGESFIGAEALLARQQALLEELRSVEPSVEQASVVLALYEDSVREEVEAFEGLVAALHPLNEAGVSLVVGIRSGMITHMGAFEGLSRAAMARRAARQELELLVNRVGMTLENVQNSRGPQGETF